MARKTRVWNKEFIEAEMEWMLNKLLEENKSDKFQIIFFKELCIERGYNDNLFRDKTKEFKDEDWYREKFFLINDILHVRLLKLGLKNHQKTSMVIWLDKTNYGAQEKEAAAIGEIKIEFIEREL